jgi:hypothetical protein
MQAPKLEVPPELPVATQRIIAMEKRYLEEVTEKCQGPIDLYPVIAWGETYLAEVKRSLAVRANAAGVIAP